MTDYWKNWWSRNSNTAINFFQVLITFGVFLYAVDQSDSAQKSADAAIAAVNQTAKQFEIENTPYLTINKFDTIGFMYDKPLYISYQIRNLVNGVVELDSSRWVYTYGLDSTSFTTIHGIERELIKIPFSKSQHYATNEFPAQIQTRSSANISKDTYNLVKHGIIKLYCAMEFHYVNLINHKKRRFEIIFRLSGSDLTTGAAIIKIKNEPLLSAE